MFPGSWCTKNLNNEIKIKKFENVVMLKKFGKNRDVENPSITTRNYAVT